MTTRQMYEEYLEAQEKRLEKLLKEKEAIEYDIKTVREMMEKNPYVK